MKHLFIPLLTALAVLFASCGKDKPEVFADLKLEKAEIVLGVDNPKTLKITAGSGEYTVASNDEKIAKASVEKDVVTLTGVAAGETTVTVADARSKQTTQVKVTVTNERTLAFVSSEVVEFKKLSATGAQDLAKDKVKEYWGNRVADNTPAELQFKGNDSLHIVKPGNIVEKYRAQWRGEELYLHNKPSDTWRYCDKKTANNGFLLNTGFYSIESKTPQRILRVAGQDYSLKAHSEIGAYPNPVGVWLKMHTRFEKK